MVDTVHRTPLFPRPKIGILSSDFTGSSLYYRQKLVQGMYNTIQTLTETLKQTSRRKNHKIAREWFYFHYLLRNNEHLERQLLYDVIYDCIFGSFYLLKVTLGIRLKYFGNLNMGDCIPGNKVNGLTSLVDNEQYNQTTSLLPMLILKYE